ncbi:hypothetical protein DIPPA_33984 [Diplonema papillatum]|nr:hypothetical protein DIPPA_33984 [Diplonema papillatum]
MPPKKKARKWTSPPPQSGSSDGTAAVPGVKDEDAVMRPSNEVSEETLASEKAKEEKIAEKKQLSDQVKMLSDQVKNLSDEKKKLSDKEETLNAHILILTRCQREKRFQSDDLGDTFVHFSTGTPSDAEVAAVLQTLKESQLFVRGQLKDVQLKAVQGQLKAVQGQLEEVQKQLTFLSTTAEAPPQV